MARCKAWEPARGGSGAAEGKVRRVEAVEVPNRGRGGFPRQGNDGGGGPVQNRRTGGRG